MRGFTAWSAAASTPPRWPLAHFFCSAFVEQNPWVPGFIVFITAGEISILFLQTLPLSPSLPPPSEPPVHGVAGPTAHRYPLHLPVVSLRSILAGSAAVSWRSLISSATSGLSLTPSTEVFTSELVPSDVDVVGQGRSVPTTGVRVNQFLSRAVAWLSLRKTKSDPNFMLHTKINSRWIKKQNFGNFGIGKLERRGMLERASPNQQELTNSREEKWANDTKGNSQRRNQGTQ